MKRTGKSSPTVLDVNILYIVIVALMIYADISPALRVWGINWAAYLPVWQQVLLAVLALITPLVAQIVTRRISESDDDRDREQSFTRVIWPITIMFLAAFYFLRNQTHFLGDGYTLIASLADNPTIYLKFRNFGESLFHLLIYRLIDGSSRGDALFVYQTVSMFSGGLFLVLTILFTQKLYRQMADRFLFFATTVTGGYALLYFGYVENYSLFMTSVVAYCFVGMAIYQLQWKSWTILIPQTLTVFFHIFGLLFIPATLILLLHNNSAWKRLESSSAKSLLMITAALTVVVYVALRLVAAKSLTLQLALVPFIQGRFMVDGYSLFSLAHLIDFINLLLLISPAVLLLVYLLFAGRPYTIKRSFGIWLTAVSIVPLAACFLLDPKLGMPRDWDLFSFSGVPIIFGLTVTLISTSGARKRLVTIGLTLAIGLAAINLFARSIALTDPTQAIKHVENYMSLDKTKSRLTSIILNNYYFMVGDTVSATAVKQHYDQMYPQDELVKKSRAEYENGQLGQAERDSRQALLIDPQYADAYALLASIFGRQERFDSAVSYFRIAIALNPNRALYQTGIAASLLRLQRDADAMHYLDRALTLDSMNVEALYWMYVYQRRHGDRRQAYKFLERAGRQNNPPHAIAREVFDYYMKSGHPELALQYFSRTEALQRDSSIVKALHTALPNLPIDSSSAPKQVP